MREINNYNPISKKVIKKFFHSLQVTFLDKFAGQFEIARNEGKVRDVDVGQTMLSIAGLNISTFLLYPIYAEMWF